MKFEQPGDFCTEFIKPVLDSCKDEMDDSHTQSPNGRDYVVPEPYGVAMHEIRMGDPGKQDALLAYLNNDDSLDTDEKRKVFHEVLYTGFVHRVLDDICNEPSNEEIS